MWKMMRKLNTGVLQGEKVTGKDTCLEVCYILVYFTIIKNR